MKSLFDYINSNSFLATLIGIVVGWILNFISTMYFNKKEEKQRKKEIERHERQKQFENKPELFIENTTCKFNIDMEIFIGTFDVKYNEGKKYKIVYPKSIKNKDNHDYKDIVIKNIGKSDIDCLDIISTNKRGIILCDYELLDNLVDNESVWYSYCYDKKIRVDESVKIRVYFEKNRQPYTLLSSTLAFLFEDQNHNYWEQPFFYEKNNVYPPYAISYKELRQAVSPDDAYDCFEQPWLW